MTRMPASLSSPTRTCVGCGKKGRRDELIRVVASPESAIVVDSRKQLPGRGAWLHPDLGCVHRSRRSGRLLRSLRLGKVDDRIWTTVEDFFAA